MKRKFLYGFGFAAAITITPLALGTPVLANLKQAGEAIVQQLTQPEVKLVMGADKQITVLDENGEPKIAWKKLEGNVTVQPGDIIRYTVESSNEGEMAAENLVNTQPIPEALTFNIGSDKGNETAEVTYSIDNGETFVAEPMVEVIVDGEVELQPAPADAYTHVKWDFDKALEANVVVDVSLEATV